MYNIILIKIMLIPNFMYTFGCVELFIILNGVTYTFMASEIFYGTFSLESNRGLIFIIFCTQSQLESRHDLGLIVEMRNLLRIIHIVLLLIFLLLNMMRCSIVH